MSQHFNLNFIGETDDEAATVRHPHLGQRLGVHRVGLTYEFVFRQDERGQSVDLIVGE